MDAITRGHEPGWLTNYRREFGAAYMGEGEGPHFENGWVTGTLMLGNSYKKKTSLYGGFQGNLLKRVRTMFPLPDYGPSEVLHLFAGEVDLATLPGDTLDLDPRGVLNPTYRVNAETCEGVPLHRYRLVLSDPPYSTSDADHYGVAMVNRNKVMQTLSDGLRSGAYVVWLDQVHPMYSKAKIRPEALIGIVGSTNHRYRLLSIWRRV